MRYLEDNRWREVNDFASQKFHLTQARENPMIRPD